jgi:L-alanine-DL-glutamate epimerase-like enolase superfamily enzyme
VKLKIMPGWDAAPVRAVAQLLAGTGIPLTVDANGAYPWPGGLAELRAIDDVGLLYIEQPLVWPQPGRDQAGDERRRPDDGAEGGHREAARSETLCAERHAHSA